MYKEIIIGPGCTTVQSIGSIIKQYHGEVVWINTSDDISYLGLERSVNKIELEKINSLKSPIGKIEIVTRPFNPELTGRERNAILGFLKNITEDYRKENILVIIDDAALGVSSFEILYKRNIACDIVMVFFSEEQLDALASMTIKAALFKEELYHSEWNVHLLNHDCHFQMPPIIRM